MSPSLEASGPSSNVRSPWAWLAALGIVLLATVISFGVMELPSHAAADVTHYKFWAHQVDRHGVAGAYSGVYPESAAIYPPVTMYGYRVAGWIYRRFYDPGFDMLAALDSHALTVLVKLVAVVPYLVGSLVIFGLLLRRFGVKPALLATAAFSLNPAVIFDVAFWGQPDAVHAVFLLIAIYLIEEDRPYPAYVFIGLAAATKPQAWALLPFLAYVSFRRFGPVRTLASGGIAAASAMAVCLPYIVYGTFFELFILPRLIAEIMPVVTANAHNIWWIITNGKPDFVLDTEQLLGPLTYRHVAVALSLLVMGYGLWRTNPGGRDGELSAMAAYLAFGWFMVTTRAHENHGFFALPLLMMATPRSTFAWVAFWVLSFTLFLNMTFHDYGLAAFRLSLFEPATWLRLQLANAGLNVVLFVVWSARLWPRGASSPARQVAQAA